MTMITRRRLALFSILATICPMVAFAYFDSTVADQEDAGPLPVPREMAVAGVPVGTILAYAGPLNRIPNSWQPCDGRLVSDSESPFDGRRLPNLMDDHFLMGVAAAKEVLQLGGSNNIKNDGNHGHGGTSGKGRNPADGYHWNAGNKPRAPQTTGLDHRHSISSGGTHGHGGDNRPAYYGVYFIIRIK